MRSLVPAPSAPCGVNSSSNVVTAGSKSRSKARCGSTKRPVKPSANPKSSRANAVTRGEHERRGREFGGSLRAGGHPSTRPSRSTTRPVPSPPKRAPDVDTLGTPPLGGGAHRAGHLDSEGHRASVAGRSPRGRNRRRLPMRATVRVGDSAAHRPHGPDRPLLRPVRNDGVWLRSPSISRLSRRPRPARGDRATRRRRGASGDLRSVALPHLVEQPPRQGGRRIQPRTRQAQPSRPVPADPPGDAGRAAGPRDQPHRHLG